MRQGTSRYGTSGHSFVELDLGEAGPSFFWFGFVKLLAVGQRGNEVDNEGLDNELKETVAENLLQQTGDISRGCFAQGDTPQPLILADNFQEFLVCTVKNNTTFPNGVSDHRTTCTSYSQPLCTMGE